MKGENKLIRKCFCEGTGVEQKGICQRSFLPSSKFKVYLIVEVICNDPTIIQNFETTGRDSVPMKP